MGPGTVPDRVGQMSANAREFALVGVSLMLLVVLLEFAPKLGAALLVSVALVLGASALRQTL